MISRKMFAVLRQIEFKKTKYLKEIQSVQVQVKENKREQGQHL